MGRTHLRGPMAAALLLPALGLWSCASPPVARTTDRTPGPPPLLEGTVTAGGRDATAEPPASVPAGQDDAAQAAVSADPVMAWVGGREVTASDLLENLLQRDSPALKRSLNLLIGARLAQMEADRLGLRLPPELVAERSAEHLEGFRAAYLREGETFEQFVRMGLDLDPDRFVERLRADTLRELVTERVVRAWSLGSEYARVRLIVLADDASVEAVQAELLAGRDFAELATERSLDATAEQGGLVPFLARAERAPLSRLAFQTPIGAVGGPLELEGAKVLLKVEDRPQPLRGTWADVGLAVEQSLFAEPVSEEEFLVWQLAMEGRHGVDVRPFHEFVREPLR
ncbi:peptidylprolyl isomerase [Engelhardtia mirabilis]|uniref:Foldase protein PrsA n=1 Tax=Engelhardtia mirabilis TaxID=2528011 RepID=A0A518BQ20_9BACT|nr:Foldase protein PrsA precursor [Planctomycetes bacterium Pla133]QDV03394.1 Foldase protein PrsA precursor [Planctomycetes bacterium Pla86]